MEFNMKRIILIFLVLMLVLSLFACGKKNRDESEDTTAAYEITTLDEGSDDVQESKNYEEGSLEDNILDGEEMTLNEVPVEDD